MKVWHLVVGGLALVGVAGGGVVMYRRRMPKMAAPAVTPGVPVRTTQAVKEAAGASRGDMLAMAALELSKQSRLQSVKEAAVANTITTLQQAVPAVQLVGQQAKRDADGAAKASVEVAHKVAEASNYAIMRAHGLVM